MINSIILSAGKGTRMKSDLPKVVQPVLGYEMVNHVLNALTDAGINKHNLILGYKKETVIENIDKQFEYEYCTQIEQLGTGHAIIIAKEKFENIDGHVLITCGDTPLIKGETYKTLIDEHIKESRDLSILTTIMDNPTGYGRIIRDKDTVQRIVEEKDSNNDEKKVKEINTGVYIFNTKKLFENIDKLSNNNAQGEYYLTDMISIFKDLGFNVGATITTDSDEVMGVNDLVALEKANSILSARINKNLMINGVQIINSSSTIIGPHVSIDKGTVIYPGNVIMGNVQIGSNCTILPNNNIIDTRIGDNTQIGPMAFLRNSNEIGNNCRIGNFVEFKNTKFGNNSKAAHHIYLGDSIIGENVNIGCGVITANYDGENKFQTKIGNNTFIGSNSNLIAPVELGDDIFVSAGSTVTENIENGKFIKSKRENIMYENKKIK